MVDPREFGSYLQQIRKDKGISLRKLGELATVSNAYISQLENGNRGIPSPDILKKIHKYLDVDYHELMERAGYIVSGQEQILELRRQLQEAYEQIRILENSHSEIAEIKKENKQLKAKVDKIKKIIIE